jgi:hypothetical protein
LFKAPIHHLNGELPHEVNLRVGFLS